jgi:predicted nucleic acid-binding protein
MVRKTDAYVDTSALIAFLDRSDSYHTSFARLFSTPPKLIASALVVAEGHGWFLRRYDRQRAMQFLHFVSELPMTIEAFDESHLQQATALIQKFKDQNLTLADADGLAIMQQRQLQQCWSTDRHLGLMGATLVT